MIQGFFTPAFRTPLLTALGLSVLFLIGGQISGIKFFATPESYLPLHTALEFLAITVCSMVFALTWNLRDEGRQPFLLLGIGFLGVALLDFGHTLSYKGMPVFVTASGPEKAINFWLAARLLSAVTLLLAAFLPLARGSLERARQAAWLVLGIAFSLGVYWLVLWHPEILPATFIPEQGLTAFKRNSEYFLVALFAAAAIQLMRRAAAEDNPNFAWLAGAAWIQGLAELFFTLYVDVADIHNLLGHLYKVVAYWMIYRGIFISGVREPSRTARDLAERLQSIIEATHVGTWEWNVQTGETRFNETWAEILGYSLAELQPVSIDTWTKLTHPDDRQQSDARLKQHFAGETPLYESEVRMRHKQGHWVWILDRGRVVARTDDGQPLYLRGTHLDITQRKLAEQALRESEQLFRALVETSAQIVWRCDPQGRATEDSPTWRAYTGQSLEEWLGYGYVDAIHPDDRARVMDNWQRALREGHRSASNEYRLRHHSGEWRWNIARAAPICDDRGTILYWVGMCSDIHDQHLATAALAASRENLETQVKQRTADLEVAKEAAEAASRAKSAFLSMASHELRTPMNGIMGTIGLAMRRTTDPVLLDYLGKADRASRQLLGIINDVLDISRIESERLTLASGPFTIREIIAHIRDAQEGMAQAKQLALSFQVDEALSRRSFVGDPMRITQVLMNLVGNAIKFTPSGSVSVAVTASAASRPENTRLHIAVTDTGIGIAPADHERIFKAFEQVDATTTRRFGGTGLGLSLCRQLVEAMGGSIGLQSQAGAGSTFWFEIEVQPDTRAEIEPPAEDGPAESRLRHQFTGRRVLLTEDEPVNREIIEILLRDAGLSVTSAEDGRAALAEAAAGTFDLILMDMNMPHMNGLAATREIRRLPAHRQTPILALTANAFAEDRAACLAAGMNDHLGKPVTPEALYQALLKWLPPAAGDAATADCRA